jgi:hypothetical protein
MPQTFEQIAAVSLRKRFERSEAIERLEQLELAAAPVSDVLADYFSVIAEEKTADTITSTNTESPKIGG